MTGYLLTAAGERLDLPPFTGWRLRRTGGVPCDSFEGVCPWDGGVEPAFDAACRLVAEEEGARRFTGVLDEYELSWDGSGGSLSLSGRGLAALLLFGLFAFCVLAVLLTGAGAYRRLTARDQAAYEWRSCTQYIATRVR